MKEILLEILLSIYPTTKSWIYPELHSIQSLIYRGGKKEINLVSRFNRWIRSSRVIFPPLLSPEFVEIVPGARLCKLPSLLLFLVIGNRFCR